jgi:hypothetical protein
LKGAVSAPLLPGPDAGCTYDLPWLGRFSWRNSVAKPDAGARTVVAGLHDTGGGQVYFYVRSKKDTGTDVDRAGLTGGNLYGFNIDGVSAETDAITLPGDSASFSLVPLGDVSQLTGVQLDALSKSSGVSGLDRPEDGSWAPSDPRNFERPRACRRWTVARTANPAWCARQGMTYPSVVTSRLSRSAAWLLTLHFDSCAFE